MLHAETDIHAHTCRQGHYVHYTYIHTHTHTHTYIHTYTHTHITYILTHTHITYIHIHTNAKTYDIHHTKNLCNSIRIYIHIRMYTYIHTGVHAQRATYPPGASQYTQPSPASYPARGTQYPQQQIGANQSPASGNLQQVDANTVLSQAGGATPPQQSTRPGENLAGNPGGQNGPAPR